jgi:outer membrane protein assembly factor BamA
MHSERAGLVAALALLAGVAPLSGQDAPSSITPATEVRSIEFRFEGTRTLGEEKLREQIALTERGGMVGLRKFFGFLPFVPPVGVHLFDPFELQRDVIRLGNLYHQSGFLRAQVSYDVRYNAESDLIEVAYVVDEGPPLLVRSLEYRGAGDAPLEVPPEAADRWTRLTRSQREEAGRLGEVELQGIAASAGRWFRIQGFPFATAVAEAQVDTAANRADVSVVVTQGPRARIRRFDVAGNETVPVDHLTRQLPVRPGDWYDADKLEQGRQQLIQLDIVRLALVDVPRQRVSDSGVVVRLEVTENPPNLVNGSAGFASDGGLTSEVEWVNRSFLGGVRTFTVGAVAQTGVLALEQPQLVYRLGATLFQPYVGHRRLSAAGGPFVEYRDDYRNRSWAYGFDGSLVWAAAPLRSVSLGYTFSRRKIFDYGFSDDLEPEDYLPILGLAAPGAVGRLDEVINRGVLRLEGSYGDLDEFANPRRGYVLRPRVEITTPGGFNTHEYVLVDLGGTSFIPLTGRIGLALRGAAGRIWPFGGSVPPAGESPFIALLRLKDVTFTTGGTREVRGWGSQVLGPKVPEVQRNEDGTFTSDRYTPLGGLARLLGSVELRMPLPGFAEEWQTFAFLDGGRVWTPDDRFRLDAEDFEQDDFFYAVGGGISYQTVVGAVQLAIGYKLNPSALDLRSAEDVLSARQAGLPATDAEPSSGRRLHLHFAIGSTF